MSRLKKLALGLCLTSALSFAACSSQSTQQSLEPTISSCPPLNSTLQFAVGTANVQGTIGLNTLETLRQKAGSNCIAGSSLLDDAPTIVGPAGFVVPSNTAAGTDAGTNKLSGNLVTSIASAPPATTFNPTGGNPGLASSYGFLPSVQTNSQVGPSFTPYTLPFFGAAQLTYIGGPPAFVPPADSGGTHTSTRDGSFPAGYLGYTLGFVNFAAAPVVGSYTLNVVIPTGQNLNTGASGTGTETATAAITNVAGLGAWAVAPTFVSDGTGGGTITTNFGGGGGTEEYVEAVDLGPGAAAGNSACVASTSLTVSYPIYYTFKVTPGTATITVPDDIGPAPPGKAQGHTFCTAADNASGMAVGDTVEVYGLAVDYPLYASAFPQSNGNPAPAITGASGQDDVTLSAANMAGTE
jgi:hypothetical protein